MVVLLYMEWDYIWKAILIVLVGIVLLRIAGRKTISQMTLAETVIMIAIGTLLVQPVSGKDIPTSILVGGVFVGTLLLMELIQMKSDTFEKIITGKAKMVIDNGNLNEKNLRKLRLSVDQLEMKLRQNSVSKISDVKWATLEPNGQLGFELKQEAQPATKKELQDLKQTIVNLMPGNTQLVHISAILTHINEILTLLNKQCEGENQESIFAEVQNETNQTPPPEHLQ